ncbi:MAG: hypothetical protein LBB09_03035 [Rickettsiales bacterium]|nr:hypothetical protein [Rickettsiales bacterium]
MMKIDKKCDCDGGESLRRTSNRHCWGKCSCGPNCRCSESNNCGCSCFAKGKRKG